MEAFVKRFADFKTYDTLTISDYDIALNSIYDEQSTLTAIGAVNINPGDFLVFGDFIGRILSASPGEQNTAEIICESILTFFQRGLVYPGDEVYVESFIASAFTDNYKLVSDLQYDMPYLMITHTDATGFIKPDIDDGFYSLKSYIAKVRRVKNVYVTFTVLGDILQVNIALKAPKISQIVFNDGRHEKISESISDSSIAKITTLQDDGTGGYIQETWYLNADGSITTIAPAARVAGAWSSLHLSVDATAADEVANEFAKNSHSHKIEFRSAESYDFYSTVRLKLGSSVLQSYISVIRLDSNDSRFLYKTGELAVTLTDRLKEMM